MRDVKRIKRICKLIEKKWTEHPDMRFGQMLIVYGIVPDSAAWDLEDDELEDILKNLK